MNLTQLRKQAKELKAAVAAGDATAIDRVLAAHPNYVDRPAERLDSTRFALRDAQLVLAREHGHTSWTALTAAALDEGRPMQGGWYHRSIDPDEIFDALRDRGINVPTHRPPAPETTRGPMGPRLYVAAPHASAITQALGERYPPQPGQPRWGLNHSLWKPDHLWYDAEDEIDLGAIARDALPPWHTVRDHPLHGRRARRDGSRRPRQLVNNSTPRLSRWSSEARFSSSMTSDRHTTEQPTPDTAGAALLTIPEAARLLRIGRSTAYELIARGELEVVHIGRSARVPPDAVASFVQRLRRAAVGAPS